MCSSKYESGVRGDSGIGVRGERKGTREKNDGNNISSLGENERIEVFSDDDVFAEEEWNEPEQN